MSPDFPYTRLPGTLCGFVRKATLWEGPDHLLSVTGNRFVESYRRFYYRDIEAIVVQKCTRLGSIGAWILSCLILFIAGSWLSYSRWIAFSLPTTIVFSLLIIYRAILSFRFSCRCFVQTAVSRESLPGLLRTWNIEPALERIRARITDAQGTLSKDITAEWQQYLEGPAVPANNSDTNDSVDLQAAFTRPQPLSSAPYSLAVNLALAGFVLCLIGAAAAFYYRDGPSPSLNSLSMRLFGALLTVAQGSTVVVSLLRIHERRALRSLRNLLLIALCFTGLEMWSGLFLRSLFSVQQGVPTIRVDVLTFWQAVSKFDAVLGLVLGVGGLILILLNWQTFRRGSLSTT